MPSRCSVCKGRLTIQPRTLCEEHKRERAKELARLRARRYRAHKTSGPTQAPGDPNATTITLTPSETSRLTVLMLDLLDKENAMRAWAADPSNQPIPPAVGEHFAAAVRVRKALTGLTDLHP